MPGKRTDGTHCDETAHKPPGVPLTVAESSVPADIALAPNIHAWATPFLAQLHSN